MGTLMIKDRPDGPKDSSMNTETFSRIAAKENASPHDRLVEMTAIYRAEHPDASERAAQSACFSMFPELHREYLNSNGEK